MNELMANWPWLDRAFAMFALFVVISTPWTIIGKLNRIIALLEQIARKD